MTPSELIKLVLPHRLNPGGFGYHHGRYFGPTRCLKSDVKDAVI
jgi:hypothetical protein